MGNLPKALTSLYPLIGPRATLVDNRESCRDQYPFEGKSQEPSSWICISIRIKKIRLKPPKPLPIFSPYDKNMGKTWEKYGKYKKAASEETSETASLTLPRAGIEPATQGFSVLGSPLFAYKGMSIKDR